MNANLFIRFKWIIETVSNFFFVSRLLVLLSQTANDNSLGNNRGQRAEWDDGSGNKLAFRRTTP